MNTAAKLLSLILIVWLPLSSWARRPVSNRVILRSVGVTVLASSMWESMEFPESMATAAPALFLIHKKNASKTRMVYNTFLKPKALCRREKKNLKLAKKTIKESSLPGYACLFSAKGQGMVQWVAVKELKKLRKGGARQALFVSTGEKSPKKFRTWLKNVSPI